ncbi:MAG: YncE family protein [Myxococcota bacterium]
MHPRTAPLALAAILAVLAVLAASGCGAEGFDSAGSAGSFTDSSNWYEPDAAAGPSEPSPPPDAVGSDVAAPDTSTPPPPPEDEVDFDLRTPEAGESHLYIPSAGLDALVVVDAATLDVHLVEVGVEPTLVRALPDDHGAVVLNRGSDDVSIVRPAEPGVFDVRTLDVLADHNRMVLSPGGEWAFLWFDPTVGGPGGFGSLQDVSAVRLVPDEVAVYDLAVGYRPTEIHFSDGGELALFFCEDGVSGVRLPLLDGDVFLPPVPVDDDPFREPEDREIAVTPDGSLAVVRDLVGEPRLTLVDLQSHDLHTLPLPDWPSDLDMTPDGGTVVVPMKATRQVALVQVPEAFDWQPPEGAEPADNPHVTVAFTGAPFGSAVLTSDASRALLYTTEPGTQAVGMVDLAAGQVSVQPMPKEITSVLVSPDGSMGALLHRRGSGSDPDLADREAYSLLDLDTGFSKILTVDNPVEEVIFTDDSEELFVLMPDPWGADHLVHRVSAGSFATVPYRTPDAPVFVGAMPGIHKVAIALDNPTGWITFVDTADDTVDQVNSFELNSYIE